MKLFQKQSVSETEVQTEAAVLEGEAGVKSPAAKAGRIPLTHRTAAKAAAFILAVLMAATAVAGIWGGLLMLNYELHTTTEEAYLQNAYRNLARSDCFTATNGVLGGDMELTELHFKYRNVAHLEIIDVSNGLTYWSWRSDTLPADGFQFEDLATWHGEAEVTYYSGPGDIQIVEGHTYGGAFTTRITLPAEPVFRDDYMMASRLISLAYDLLYWVWIIGAAAAVAAVACFVFLLCAAGHHGGLPGVRPGWGTPIPFDLLTAGLGLGGFFLLQLAYELSYSFSDLGVIFVFAAAGIVLLIAALGWCMSFALRVKLGGWWKNTIICRALVLCWRVLKGLGRGLAAFFRGCGSLLAGVPLVWKTALAFIGVTAIEALSYALITVTWWWAGVGGILIAWTVVRVLLFALVIALALMLRRLQKGGEALAAGDLSHQVDTRRMLPDFRKHGENLNSLGAGMTIAVEQRLKSERMKTELITNVSHDIKTPLTSIINYADLIGKEQTENEKIRDYSVVLLRQSERLKRLIDDLVEASKASTGNLEVLLAPCEAGVMLTQAAGEYEQRLENARLELVTTQPERPVKIMADGRRLWRVFDNLMNNICKYAQPGTRVYLTLEEVGGQAVISFKNTSRDPLNIPADELMERFIRGDASRNTEGNGLGLSIAKSLTDLQKGSFELAVDGDLFKVILRFPTI